jgi:hypothetical protein
MNKSLLLVLLLLCAPCIASANDGFSAVGIGGITIAKTDKIAIKKEVLDISYEQIHVAYDFINESDKDEEALIMFPFPDYSAGMIESGNSFAIGQPDNFSVTVDGKSVEYQMQLKALIVDEQWENGERKVLKETDVTDKLHAAGLTDEEIAGIRFKSKYIYGENGEEGHFYIPLSESMIEKLKKEGLLGDGNMGDITPQWDNRITYIWKQVFHARKVIHVEHSYQPFISGGSDAGYRVYKNCQDATELSEYCLSNENLNTLRNLYKDQKNIDVYLDIPGVNVKYILTTANSWKDGIRDFTLRLHAKSKDEIVSLCFSAELKKKSSVLYEAHIQDFHPQQELSVYFGNVKAAYDLDNTGVPPKTNDTVRDKGAQRGN